MAFDKIYLIGNGRVADDCLRILVKRNIPVEFIEIYAEKFAFTGKLCERLGVPFRHYDKQAAREFLLGLKDKILIISAHNSYIFPAEVCEKENLTIINLHIAFLPEYRGMNPSTWAIFNQEEYAGATWHTVSSKIDSGGIIVQNQVPIGEDETAIKLMLRCFREGIRLFEENLESFINGSFTTFVPADPNTRLYLGKELPNDGYLDEAWDFSKAYAFLRSMDYSGANLMRLPRVRKEGKIYEITTYKKIANDARGDLEIAEQTGNTLNMVWGEGYCLSCTLREAADQS